VDNAAGLVGAYIAYVLRYWLGGGTYVGLALVSVAAAVWLAGRRIRHLPWRALGAVVLTIVASAALSRWSPPPAGSAVHGLAGVVGINAGDFVHRKFGPVGGWIVLAVVGGIGLLFAADDLFFWLLRRLRAGWMRWREHRARRAESAKLAKQALEARRKKEQAARAASAPPPAPAKPARTEKPSPPAPATGDDKRAEQVKPSAGEAKKEASKPSLLQRVLPGMGTGDDDAGKGKKAPPAGEGQQDDAAAKASPASTEYEPPSADLLAAPQRGYIESQQAQAAEKAQILQTTLDDFNVSARVVGHMTGPVITLFEVALEPGVKVSHVSNLASDIARTLAVPSVRIFAPIPGKDTVGIEVPNAEKEIVRIRQLMDLADQAADRFALPLYLGKDAGGDPIAADLGSMPHLLIAGTTGSGKSVCINSIILSLLLTRSPEQVKFILVDPKMVEMAAFENIQHLLCPIVNDMRKAEDILEWAATKMDERYELLKEAGVRNIRAFNKLSAKDIYKRFGADDEEERKRIPTNLPYYVIIVDELADLMMTSGKEVESHIIRIAQKARAVGIHLVLATQRPSVNVVTGLIKSNMPCRISFRVASRQESRIVLDQNGAEVLLGQGDMLFLQPGTSNLVRAQGAYVEDDKVVEALREAGQPEYNAELVRLQSRPPGEADGEKDDLFDKAVEIVLASQRGSVSLLQRRLQIGYSRASRIIDQMAEAGLLGEYKGSQARECMMSLEEWREFQQSIADDQSGASSSNGEPTSV
jgi:S-DNA-T family DNA segregation ATPase FtsK/SpoIIIE